MKIDISTLTYEELFINDNIVTMYFIAPKELVAEKYPEAEFATICIEYCMGDTRRDRYILRMSPTKSVDDGYLDYDWIDIEMPVDNIEALVYQKYKLTQSVQIKCIGEDFND